MSLNYEKDDIYVNIDKGSGKFFIIEDDEKRLLRSVCGRLIKIDRHTSEFEGTIYEKLRMYFCEGEEQYIVSIGFNTWASLYVLNSLANLPSLSSMPEQSYYCDISSFRPKNKDSKEKSNSVYVQIGLKPYKADVEFDKLKWKYEHAIDQFGSAEDARERLYEIVLAKFSSSTLESDVDAKVNVKSDDDVPF